VSATSAAAAGTEASAIASVPGETSKPERHADGAILHDAIAKFHRALFV
jgi:hypothetical protein